MTAGTSVKVPRSHGSGWCSAIEETSWKGFFDNILNRPQHPMNPQTGPRETRYSFSSAQTHSNRRNSSLLLAGLFASICVGGEVLVQNPPTPAPTDAAKYLEDVKALSSPEMEGRGDGSKGLALAERLIVERYKSLGLEPAGSKGYLQPFRVVTGRKILDGTKMSGQANGEKTTVYTVNDDFVPLNFSSVGKVKAALVFGGYGITAPEFSYDDFRDADVRDKVVLVLRGEPEALAQKASTGGHTAHASLISKAINAKNHGAAALIVVSGRLPHGESDELIPFGRAEGPEEAGIICLQVKAAVADEWLRSTGLTAAELEDSIEKEKGSGLAIPLDSSTDITLKIE